MSHPWLNHNDSCDCHIGICMDCGCTNEVGAGRAVQDGLDPLLTEIVRNGVPPDALMVPDWGPANENLYRWWHEQWAPTLQKVRERLAAPPLHDPVGEPR